VAAIEARGPRRPGMPVLVLSQYVEQLYARELLLSGAEGIGYLLKDRVRRRRHVRRDGSQGGGRRPPCSNPDVVTGMLTHHDRSQAMAPADAA